jgi:hypothetical protein
MISFRSRIERWQERYSRANLWLDSERSVGSDEDDSMEMMIEVELCSTFRQSGWSSTGRLLTTMLPYCLLFFSRSSRVFSEACELLLTQRLVTINLRGSGFKVSIVPIQDCRDDSAQDYQFHDRDISSRLTVASNSCPHPHPVSNLSNS